MIVRGYCAPPSDPNTALHFGACSGCQPEQGFRRDGYIFREAGSGMA